MKKSRIVVGLLSFLFIFLYLLLFQIKVFADSYAINQCYRLLRASNNKNITDIQNKLNIINQAINWGRKAIKDNPKSPKPHDCLMIAYFEAYKIIPEPYYLNMELSEISSYLYLSHKQNENYYEKLEDWSKSGYRDWTNIAVALGTMFLAIITFILAIASFVQIKQNKKFRIEESRPYCVLVSNNDSSLKQDWIFGKSMTVPGIKDSTYELPIFKCMKIKNIGTGPALDIKIEIRPANLMDNNNPQYSITPIAPGESPYEIELKGLSENYFEINSYYVIYIQYKDIFGNTFEAIYPGMHGKPTFDNNMNLVAPLGKTYEIIYQRVIKSREAFKFIRFFKRIKKYKRFQKL